MKRISRPFALLMALVLLVVSGCSNITGPAATEVEVVIDPQTLVPQTSEQAANVETTPIPTNTLRPTPAETATPEPTATPALDPYSKLIAEASALTEAEKYDEAAAKLTEAINSSPNDPRAYLQRGIIYNGQNKVDEAITDFNFAINYNPNDPAAYNARGITFVHKQQYEQAIRDFNKALEIDPKYIQAYINRAIAYIQQQSMDKALADFNKAVELAPDNPEMYFNRGQAYLTLFEATGDKANLDLCVADFNQSIAFDPQNTDSYFNRGSCLFLQGKFADAYNDFSQAITLDGTDARYYLYRANLYPAAGTLDGALADANKVLELTQEEDLRAAAQELIKTIPTMKTPTPAPNP